MQWTNSLLTINYLFTTQALNLRKIAFNVIYEQKPVEYICTPHGM